MGSSSLTRDGARPPALGAWRPPGKSLPACSAVRLLHLKLSASLQPEHRCLPRTQAPPYPGPILAGIWGRSGGGMSHRRGDGSCLCRLSPGMLLPSSQHSLHASKHRLLLRSACQVVYSAPLLPFSRGHTACSPLRLLCFFGAPKPCFSGHGRRELGGRGARPSSIISSSCDPHRLLSSSVSEFLRP